MLRFRLKKLIEEVAELRGEKFYLTNLSKESGLDKNALSRLANHPKITPSSEVYNKLLNFAYNEFRKAYKNRTDQEVAELIQRDFVLFVPDALKVAEPNHITPDDFEYHTRYQWKEIKSI